MKTLYLIGGPMGVGKTTVSRILKKKLPNSVFLDGDWCWDADPWHVTDETKRMVLDNICYLLHNFLRCSAYENIVFCWVMHMQAVIDEIVSRLCEEDCRILCISLVCSEQALRQRLQNDVARGLRAPDILDKSAAYLGCYGALRTVKLDVSAISAEDAAGKILLLSDGAIFQ